MTDQTASSALIGRWIFNHWTREIPLVVQWLNYFIIWINYALLILYWWVFRVSLIFSYEDFHNQPGFLYIKDQVGRVLRHGQLDLNCLLPVAVCRGESVSIRWKCASVPFPASCPTFTLNVLCLVTKSCPTLGDPMDCSLPGSSVHGDSPGKNTGVGCHVLLQGIFPTQGSNPGLLYCRWILYCLSHQLPFSQQTFEYLCYLMGIKSCLMITTIWVFPIITEIEHLDT